MWNNRKNAAGLIVAALMVAVMSVPSFAKQAVLNVDVSQSVLPADKKNTVFLKVGLKGFKVQNPEKRTPLNVAIVIDRSSSMSGEKIAKAREAAVAAVRRLSANDIVSVVTYSSTVHVLVPSTKLTDKESVIAQIRSIQPGGSTALFGGVSKGALEVKKFLSKERVNRVVLLSDGLANVGPSSPSELQSLGLSLGKQGIAVSTMGLGSGYNEDLMMQLAAASDGNHIFIEGADMLASIFQKEFGDALAVTAQDIDFTVKCAPGIRPVRKLGREADISGQIITSSMTQLAGGQEKFLLLELEVPPGEHGQTRALAEVEVAYHNTVTNTKDKLTSSIRVSFAQSQETCAKSINNDVMVSSVHLIATEKNEMALNLRDKGKIKEAEELLKFNCGYLYENAERYNSKVLKEYFFGNQKQAQGLDDDRWNQTRKDMRDYQFENLQQRSYSSRSGD